MVGIGEQVRAKPAVLPRREGDPRAPVPLSPAQRDLWVFQSMNPDSSAINLCFAYEFDRPVDPDTLVAALNIVMDNHDVLRSLVVETPDGPLLVPGPRGRWDMDRLDLRHLPPTERARAVEELTDRFRRRSYRLTEELPVRARFIRLTDDTSMMLMDMHHLVTDWWSTAVFNRDFDQAYRSLTTGAVTPPPRPDRQYADYASWQRELEAAGVHDQQLEFWRTYLADFPQPPAIAAPLRPRAEVTLAGGQYTFDFPQELVDRVRAFARETDSTLFTALMPAFAAFLHRISGERDLVIGTPAAQRSARGSEPLVGYFMNVLPTRWHIDPAADLRGMVSAFRQSFREVQANADVPNGRLIKEINPDRLHNRAPLFQWVFMHLPDNGAGASLPEGARGSRVLSGSEEQDGALILDNVGDGITASFEYRRDLFTPATIAHLSSSFLVFLDGLLAGGRVNEAALVGGAERDTVVSEWNRTDRPVEARPVHELVGSAVGRERAAVAAGGSTLSYGELADRSDRLAWFLARTGVRRGDAVGVCQGRSPEAVVALLGVLKAGAVYVPLDPELPVGRAEFMVADSGVRVVLTDAVSAGGVPSVPDVRTVVVDGADASAVAGAEPVELPAVTGCDLAYVIYTSGSTGTPKGVAVEHGSLGLLVAGQAREFGVTESDRFLQTASFSFDASIEGICTSLAHGACLEISPGLAGLAPEDLLALAGEAGITLMDVPTAYWHHLVRALRAGATMPDSVRLVMLGGEAIDLGLVGVWHELGVKARLMNGYGPTEATVTATMMEMHADDALRRLVIGRPLDNVRTYVLDATLQPVPVGVTGELHLGGPRVARGYTGQPALTASRFVADPFAAPGTYMYRTGDLARWRDDGVLEFIGRADGQVKIRGFRVETGEVEAVLTRRPGVREALVMVREDQPGVRHLVGYVVPEPDAPPLVGPDLRGAVAAELPHYMVPAAVLIEPHLPLTTSGKVDRAALRAPDFSSLSGRRAPRNRREEVLGEAFADVLGLDGVGIDDSFFALGGDSIAAIHVVSQARRAGLVITPRDVYACRTVAALAEVAVDSATVVPEDQDAGIGVLGAVPALRALEASGAPSAPLRTLLTTPHGLRQEHLVHALGLLESRHDMLRLRRSTGRDGAWVLETLPVGDTDAGDRLVRVETSGLDEARRGSLIKEHAAAAYRRLAPDEARVLQAVWFDAGPTAAGRLLLTVHPLTADETSLRLLVADLAQACADLVEGRPFRPAPVATSYRTWSTSLAREAADPRRIAQLSHWTGLLQAPRPIPAGPAPVADATARRAALDVVVRDEVAHTLLTRVPEAFRTDVGTVLLTALAVTADARTRQGPRTTGDTAGDGVVIALREDGRRTAPPGTDLSRTVGRFDADHPVRLVPGVPAGPDGPAMVRALKAVKEQLRSAPPGSGFGLLRHLNAWAEQELAALPGPGIAFTCLDAPSARTSDGWETAPDADRLPGLLPEDDTPLHAPLAVHAMPRITPDGPRLTARWSWAEGRLAEDEVRELADAWCAALETLAAHVRDTAASGLTPGDLPLVDLRQDEIEQLEAAFAVQGGIADVLPLSPLQEGMLFHALSGGDTTDVYSVHAALDIRGLLSPDALRAAAVRMMERHANLRVSFVPLDSGQTVQVVPRTADVPWRTIEVRGATEEDEDREVERVLAAERVRPFDLTAGPLCRFTLLRLSADRHVLVVCNHHILWDGWSSGVFVSELFEIYRYGGAVASLPDVSPFAGYLGWLADQDGQTADTAWHRALEGVAAPTRVAPASGATPDPARQSSVDAGLPADITARLDAVIRARGITVNTVVQTVWSLTLARYTGEQDIVFGTTVSGRPPELPGIERMIGLFINTVPVRITLDRAEALPDLFARVQDEQSALLGHQHVGLARIQRLTGLRDLFDTLVVVENFRTAGPAELLAGCGLELTRVRHLEGSHYPLTLMVAPGDRLEMRLLYHPEAVDTATAEALATTVRGLMTALADRLDGTVGDLLATAPALPLSAPVLPAAHQDTPAHPGGAAADRSTAHGTAPTAPTEPAGPAAPTERVLREIWESVLGRAEIGADDNFFALGGDSILGIRVVALARRRGVELRVDDLMRLGTIRELAARTAGFGGSPESAERAAEPFGLLSPRDAAAARRTGALDAYPMTRLQTGMVLENEKSPVTYHAVARYLLRGDFDAERWHRAVSGLLTDHEILRTSFALTGYRGPVQLVHAQVPVPLTVEDLRDLSEADRQAHVRNRQAREQARPFDIVRPPLVRFRLQRLSDAETMLFVTEHHAVLDGWSDRSLVVELLNRYSGAHHAAPPASRFRSYVELELRSLDDHRARAFWADQLADATYPSLPTAAEAGHDLGAPTAAGAGAPGSPAARGTVAFGVDASVHAGLTRLAGRLGVPLRTVLLTAHLRVMSLLTGSREVTTGAVYNGRTEETDGDRVLGLFLNTLPLHTTLPRGDWTELVRHVGALDNRVQEHRRYPLSEVARIAGRPNLIESYFNYTHFHVELDRDTTAGAVEIHDHQAGVETEFPFQAEFSVDVESQRLTVDLGYDTRRYAPVQIERAGASYRAVLEALATRPDAGHHTDALRTDADPGRSEVVDDTAGQLPAATLAGLFGEQAARTPLAVAVVSGAERLTYAELDGRVERLARVLAGRGVGPDAVVAVALPRSVDLVVTLLAVHRAGAAYLPLDLGYPAERLAFMLVDAAPACLVTSSETLPLGDGVPRVLVDALDGEPSAPLPRHHHPDGAAYVIYTSGSTGRPKGVVVPHRGIVNRLASMQDDYGLTADDRVLQKTPSSFDVSVWEFFWPLVNGATLVLAAPDGHRDPAYLAGLIRGAGVTTVHFVPSMLDLFLDEPAAADCRGLRRVLCSGEALTRELADRFREVLDTPLHNLYGPTEASVDVTSARVPDSGPVTIGRPGRNTRVQVLDENLTPVPVGTPGELYLAGDQLARGYLNRPGLTAERFVADPCGPAGSRMYRTGDLVRMHANGHLEYLGRTDQQVKIRGMRVELGEIEAVLASHPQVARAVVVAHEDRQGVRRLVGYVLARGTDGTPLDVAALRASAADRLPGHMVPALIVELTELPLTPSGKLDQRALPAPEFTGATAGSSTVAPAAGPEELLAGVFADVLGQGPVGAEDAFFDLGGDSLLAVELVARSAAAGLGIQLVDVFTLQTVRALAGTATAVADAMDVAETAETPEDVPKA
ncbi:amino acid adenylation domain-containing protein [Streptomyces fuscichromogenes]|uniref:non-ribosomal peptide synthetase n=1 Tax=Streptomyces fuscichromogenes TaxID=1324013 RepID=UPI003813B0DF